MKDKERERKRKSIVIKNNKIKDRRQLVSLVVQITSRVVKKLYTQKNWKRAQLDEKLISLLYKHVIKYIIISKKRI